MTGALSDKTWWWLDSGPKSGAWNMAADQFFAEHISIFKNPIMRIYQWRPWCISLGYHQSIDCINQESCRKEWIDIVRRQTGGRAVLHAEEITYSIVLPKNHTLSVSVSDTYHRLSEGLAAGLRRLGITAKFQKHIVDLKTYYNKKISTSCFSAAALHEIMVNNRKLVGSAQRRLPTSVLQHGSILIGPAHLNLFRYVNNLTKDQMEILTQEMEQKTIYINEIDPVLNYQVIGPALKKGIEQTLDVQFQGMVLSSDHLKKIEDRKQSFSILSNQ